jgi:hypothetical protein
MVYYLKSLMKTGWCGKMIIKDQTLARNVLKLCEKIENNFFNLVIIYGATRAGKSTLSMQMCQDMAQKLNVPFTVDNIFFGAKELLDEMKKGKRKHIYQLDEAAFNLKGADWADEVQKDLIKFIDTAAKYNQTLIIIIPYIEELKYRFIRDIHTKTMEVTFNPFTYERGWVKMYNHAAALKKYNLLKYKQFFQAGYIKNTPARFTAETGAIDMVEYDKKKDAAIQALGEKEEKGKANLGDIIAGKLIAFINKEVGGWNKARIAEDILGIDARLVSKFKKYEKMEYKGRNSSS